MPIDNIVQAAVISLDFSPFIPSPISQCSRSVHANSSIEVLMEMGCPLVNGYIDYVDSKY